MFDFVYESALVRVRTMLASHDKSKFEFSTPALSGSDSMGMISARYIKAPLLNESPTKIKQIYQYTKNKKTKPVARLGFIM